MSQETSPVPRIELSGGTRFDSASEIPIYVEQPLIPTCLNLFNKNILTFWSSANPQQIFAELGINFHSLSSQNKRILLQKVQGIDESEPDIIISLPTTNPEEVHQYFFDLAQSLEFQEATWETTYTLDHLQRIGAGDSLQEIIERTNYYYNPEDKLFFRSEKAYNRFHGKNLPETI